MEPDMPGERETAAKRANESTKAQTGRRRMEREAPGARRRGLVRED